MVLATVWTPPLFIKSSVMLLSKSTLARVYGFLLNSSAVGADLVIFSRVKERFLILAAFTFIPTHFREPGTCQRELSLNNEGFLLQPQSPVKFKGL